MTYRSVREARWAKLRRWKAAREERTNPPRLIEEARAKHRAKLAEQRRPPKELLP